MDCLCIIKGDINFDRIKNIQPSHIQFDRVMTVNELVQLSLILDTCPVISFGDSFPRFSYFNDDIFQGIYHASKNSHTLDISLLDDKSSPNEEILSLGFNTDLKPLRVVHGRMIRRYNGLKIRCQTQCGIELTIPDMLSSASLKAIYDSEEVDAGSFLNISIGNKLISIGYRHMKDIPKLFKNSFYIKPYDVIFKLIIHLLDGTVHESEGFTMLSRIPTF